jgi:hypothetical protein
MLLNEEQDKGFHKVVFNALNSLAEYIFIDCKLEVLCRQGK